MSPELYHVSLVVNRPSILANGISPAFAQGNLTCVWWVEFSRLEWALLHVASRRRVRPSDLEVWAAEIDPRWLIRCALNGVYQVRYVVWTQEVHAAMMTVAPDAV